MYTTWNGHSNSRHSAQSLLTRHIDVRLLLCVSVDTVGHLNHHNNRVGQIKNVIRFRTIHNNIAVRFTLFTAAVIWEALLAFTQFLAILYC
jgi:hypothetical protein